MLKNLLVAAALVASINAASAQSHNYVGLSEGCKLSHNPVDCGAKIADMQTLWLASRGAGNDSTKQRRLQALYEGHIEIFIYFYKEVWKDQWK